MHRPPRLSLPITLAALLLVASAATRIDASTRTGSAASAPATHSAQAAALSPTTTATRILTTAEGHTLYVFAPDKPNQSVCTGACAQFWPPLLLPAGKAIPTNAPGAGGTFGVAVRSDGTRQLSYDGAPLYTFVKDKQPGDLAGQGVEGIWWAMVASPAIGAAPAPAASTTGGSDASGLTWDTATQTTNLTLETSHDGTHNGFNFNGYAMGGLVISIPLNYRVNVTLRNKGPIPHSAVITAYANRANAVVFPPAFDGASSPAPLQGNTAGSVQTFSFIASQTGTYALVCAVSRHAEFGMWDTFIVTRGGAPSITPMTM